VPNPDKTSADYLKVVELAAAQGIGKDNVDAARYDALVLLALGIQAAGKNDGSAVKALLGDISHADPGDVVIHPGEWSKAKDALLAGKKINYEGGSGPIEFSPQGDPTVGYIGLWKVVKGAGGYTIDDSMTVHYQL